MNFVNSRSLKNGPENHEKHENHEKLLKITEKDVRVHLVQRSHYRLGGMAKENQEKAEKAAAAAKMLRAQKAADGKKVATPARAANDASCGPPRRVTGKRPALAETVEAIKKGKKASPQEEEEFEVSWANISKVMQKYNLTERQATEALLMVIGPSPEGARFWDSFKQRLREEHALEKASVAVKSEPVKVEPGAVTEEDQEESQVSPGKRRRLNAYFNPCEKADEQEPDAFQENVETEEEDEPDEECPEDLPAPADPEDDEPMDEEEEDLEVEGGGGDDHSPESGAGRVQQMEVPKQVCTKQPLEPVEPVRPSSPDPNVERAQRALAESILGRPLPSDEVLAQQSRTQSEMHRLVLLGFFFEIGAVFL